MIHNFLAAVLIALGVTAAQAQQTIPIYNVPTSLGPGKSGWGASAPLANGVFVSLGTAAKPNFQAMSVCTTALTWAAGTGFACNASLTPGTNAVPNASLAQAAAVTIKGNPTSSTANVQDFTISGLTANVAPDASLDYTLMWNHTTGTLQKVAIGVIAASATSGVSSFGGMTGALTCGIGIICSGTTASTYLDVIDVVRDYGAVGDCVTVNTTAFQNAIDAAKASGGKKKIVIPSVSASGCYLVGALNMTGITGLTIEGHGVGSLIKAYDKDAANNWIDLCDSSDITIRNINIAQYSTVIPKVLLLWCQKNGGTLPSGLILDRVNIDAKSSVAHFFGHNYFASLSGVGGGLMIRDSSWVQRNNGSVNGVGTPTANVCAYGSAGYDPGQCNTVIRLDGTNAVGITSANVTIETDVTGVNVTSIINSNFIDSPSGYGSGTRTYNTTMALVRSGTFQMLGGSIRTLGPIAAIVWDNSEGNRFQSVRFENSDGSGNTAYSWIGIGGGLNGFLILDMPFFSVPATGGAFLVFGPVASGAGGVGSGGGIGHLSVRQPNVGGNSNNAYFISQYFPCSASPGAWITASQIEYLTGANNIVSCGSIDNKTVMYGVGTIGLGTGATDSSFKIP